MLVYNKKQKTLAPEEHHYELQNVKKPKLFRETFPYAEIPKISFNNTAVPMNPPDDIWITDTTFRDGQQAITPLTVEQISTLFDFLHKLGGPNGMVRQTEFFLYTDKDKAAVRKCQEKGYEFPQITSWIRATKSDFKLVKEMGIKETGILTSCSDYHIFSKLNKTRREALDMYLDIVKAALDEGITPRCHFEDITRADFYGFVIPFASELMKLAQEAKTKIKIRACDTLGLGVGLPGAALPRSVNGIIHGLNHFADVPSEWLEWHGHNDFYRAVTNSTNAWLYGCAAINTSLLGIGERTGNTALEAMAIEYAALRGDTNGMDLSVITEVANYFKKTLKYKIPANQPYVGAYFNMTRAGIHADGLLKEQEIYNIFDTQAILNRPPEVAITNMGGLASIAFWVSMHVPCFSESGKQIEKTDPGIAKIKDHIDAEFAAGRTNIVNNDEMFELVKKYMPEILK
ncbi:MAG: 2-isopropylmalate synthase [Elusimicrobia bacterium]|nr:2-isopropylmalate synthase [Elusimicrobiota bacterium]